MDFVVALWQLRASFTYFEDLLRFPHKRIVTVTKVYIARSNMQVQFIRFHQKYRLYSRLLLRSEGALGQHYVYSLVDRWQQLVTNKLITIIKLGLQTGAGSSHGKSVQATIRFVIQSVIFFIPFMTL